MMIEDAAIRELIPTPREWYQIVPRDVGWDETESLTLQAAASATLEISRLAHKFRREFVFVVGPEHLRRHADPMNAELDDLRFPLNRVVIVSAMTLYRRPDGTIAIWKQRYPEGSVPIWGVGDLGTASGEGD